MKLGPDGRTTYWTGFTLWRWLPVSQSAFWQNAVTLVPRSQAKYKAPRNAPEGLLLYGVGRTGFEPVTSCV